MDRSAIRAIFRWNGWCETRACLLSEEVPRKYCATRWLLSDYHAAIGEIIIKYNGTLERYAGDGVMVVFNDPVPVENPALQAVLMALEVREAIGGLTEKWRRWGHDLGFGIGIAHGFATLGTIGFEGRFDYAAIGTVSNELPLGYAMKRSLGKS